MAYLDEYQIFADATRKENLRQRLVVAVCHFAAYIIAAPAGHSAGLVYWAKTVQAEQFSQQAIGLLLTNPDIAPYTAEAISDVTIQSVTEAFIVPAFVGV